MTVDSTNKIVIISISEMIDLLKNKLLCLEEAEKLDSSWNYPIEETKADIELLEALL